MPRSGTLGNPQPYTPFGVFAGLPFWGGGLTLLAAAPGLGKTSWLLRMIFDAATAHFPAAIGCYEHTPEELRYRLFLQVEAMISGPHTPASREKVERKLANASESVLLSLNSQEDTVRGLEDMLLNDYSFPIHGSALVAVDYLNRVPVVGLTGMMGEAGRSGEAAASLRELARRHGWAVIAAAALKSEAFENVEDLSALLGDERVPYEADRVLVVQRGGIVQKCDCVSLEVITLKDRTGPTRRWPMQFWGARFYPALESEFHKHEPMASA
ncbi:MAG: DnaB-like helicase C-terminal domain-containing protein [Chloroflexota bacterium]